ncbi:putative ribonuclease H-like domain, reverse transcriptase zinc-binding domain-containing protein [Senna tora]|uniref:Putative ribonuclease H-like domain, reverse transcriptase zinc-binding domain-containing protein n=1 Tax=Senna tora TaxID=362788 RepID=A0A834W6S2_9FABA|nr:putative ribonuclease H-like domain, reverse transcriptase zinc-binding domain-containing protein [Senna tora]
MGPKASWVWSSLLEGRKFLEQGCCWRIGDGSRVGFWEDRWIPTFSGNKLNDVNGDVNLKIPYVISNGSWDVSKLVGLVSREELNAILAIPLRSGCLEDRLMLAEAKNGLYYIKLGYKFGMNLSRDVLIILFGGLALRLWPLMRLWLKEGAFRCICVGNSGRWDVKLSFVWQKLILFLLLIRQLEMEMSFRTNVLKCNVDGTFHSGSTVGGVGINCRNALGEVSDGCAEKVSTCSSLLIEAWVLKKALLLACLKGWERVVFEFDCSVLVDVVAGLKGAKASRQSSCRLVSEEGVKRVVMKDWVFNPPLLLASILAFDVTRSGSNIGDRSSNNCFSAGCAVGCAFG